MGIVLAALKDSQRGYMDRAGGAAAEDGSILTPKALAKAAAKSSLAEIDRTWAALSKQGELGNHDDFESPAVARLGASHPGNSDRKRPPLQISQQQKSVPVKKVAKEEIKPQPQSLKDHAPTLPETDIMLMHDNKNDNLSYSSSPLSASAVTLDGGLAAIAASLKVGQVMAVPPGVQWLPKSLIPQQEQPPAFSKLAPPLTLPLQLNPPSTTAPSSYATTSSFYIPVDPKNLPPSLVTNTSHSSTIATAGDAKEVLLQSPEEDADDDEEETEDEDMDEDGDEDEYDLYRIVMDEPEHTVRIPLPPFGTRFLDPPPPPPLPTQAHDDPAAPSRKGGPMMSQPEPVTQPEDAMATRRKERAQRFASPTHDYSPEELDVLGILSGQMHPNANGE
uniref:Uncharacterized protein n=1 Tax=Entomoneis paludosa TaxID=265537 RepID=A0A7S3DTH1_9STRA|mmetsp:Transcript_3502/g.7284  ORF Transcript_3502/g.7284 Transcript_3502/m.7284 type:complete len:391 (+) Transcript_3502:1667-2839(+)